MGEQVDWEAYYKKQGETDELHPEVDPTEIYRCLAALSVFPREEVASLVDVGCGDGYFCHWIAGKRKIGRVVGTDISRPRLERAGLLYPEVEFVWGSLPRLPFADGEFEVVTCIEVLEHQMDPGAVVRELARIASRYVVVTVPDGSPVEQFLCPHCLKTFPASGHLHAFTPDGLAKFGEEAGLRVDMARRYYMYPFAARRGPLRWLGWGLRRGKLLLGMPGGFFQAVRMAAGG